MSDLDYIERGSARVNGQYRFVSHDQVTAALHPLLVKHRVVIIPTVQEMQQDNNRTTVKLLISFVNVDDPQDEFSVSSYGAGIDNGDKGIGKAYSYAYKYALLKTFNLETGDDPDNDASAVYEPKKCLEFDSMIPEDFTDEERERIQRFLVYGSEYMKQPVEDVKRAAILKMPEFIAAFRKWEVKNK